MSTIHNGIVEQLGPQALLHPAVAGAQHFGNDQRHEADQQTADSRAGPSRQGRAGKEADHAVEALGVEQPDEAAEDADQGKPAQLRGIGEAVAADIAEQRREAFHRPEHHRADRRGDEAGQQGRGSKSSR